MKPKKRKTPEGVSQNLELDGDKAIQRIPGPRDNSQLAPDGYLITHVTPDLPCVPAARLWAPGAAEAAQTVERLLAAGCGQVTVVRGRP